MGMVIIEILADPVNRRGTSKKTGNDYNIWFQEAYLHQADGGYPQKFEFLVRDGVVLPRGKYTVTDRCFYINNDGRLSIRLEEGLAEPSTALADFGKTVQSLKASA